MNKNGLTLIEVIISIAILGIVVMAFSTFIGSNYVKSIKLGQESQAVFEAKTGAEAILNDQSFADSSSTPTNLVITFGSNNIVVPGNIVEVAVDSVELYNDDKARMRVFQPD